MNNISLASSPFSAFVLALNLRLDLFRLYRILATRVSDNLHVLTSLIQRFVRGLIFDIGVLHGELPNVIDIVVAITMAFNFSPCVVRALFKFLEFLYNNEVEAVQNLIPIVLCHLVGIY